jgi:predicted Zn finger-like uncharacterized protein
MHFVCPNCSWSHEFDEAMVGPRGTVVRCEKCRRFYRIMGGRETEEKISPGWMIRKKDGRIVRVIRLSDLHSLILEGAVSERDEFSRTGKTWRKISEIYELSGMFELARLDGRKQSPAARQKTGGEAERAGGEAVQPLQKKPSSRPRLEPEPARPTRAADPDAPDLLVFPILLKRSMRIDLDDSKVLPLPLKTVQETIEDMAIPIPLKRVRAFIEGGEEDTLPIPLEKRRIVRGKKPAGGGRGRAGKKSQGRS